MDKLDQLEAENASFKKRIIFLEGENARLRDEIQRLRRLVVNPHPIKVPLPSDPDRLERIATAALQGILGSPDACQIIGDIANKAGVENAELTAKIAAGQARALIAELDGEQDNGN